jgi:hypothetical protein
MVTGRTRQSPDSLPFTRKEFSELAAECKTYAAELANFEPRRVNLQQCHRFNAWLSRLRRYEGLGVRLSGVRTARPVTRWQVAILTAVTWLVLTLALGARIDRLTSLFILNGTILFVLALYMMPERVVGTTIEEIEGRVLRVVRELDAMLAAGEMHFSEAAHHQVKSNLDAAALELRQQLDLAHRE